jgi:hypothetical protein
MSLSRQFLFVILVVFSVPAFAQLEDQSNSSLSALQGGSSLHLDQDVYGKVAISPPSQDEGTSRIVVGWSEGQFSSHLEPFPRHLRLLESADELRHNLIVDDLHPGSVSHAMDHLTRLGKTYQPCLTVTPHPIVFSSYDAMEKGKLDCKNAGKELSAAISELTTAYRLNSMRGKAQTEENIKKLIIPFQSYVNTSFAARRISQRPQYCGIYFKKGTYKNNGLPTVMGFQYHKEADASFRDLKISSVEKVADKENKYIIKVSGDPAIESITCFNVKTVNDVYSLFQTDATLAKIKKPPTQNIVSLPPKSVTTQETKQATVRVPATAGGFEAENGQPSSADRAK